MGRQSEIKDYIHAHSFFSEALSKLKPGREIAMKLNLSDEPNDVDLVMLLESQNLTVEFRSPKNADVCFHANDRAIEKVLSTRYDSIAAFGIEVVKLIISKDMKIQILTGPLKLIMGGYLDIIKLGGGEFWALLKEHGLKGPTDVIKIFKKLKRS